MTVTTNSCLLAAIHHVSIVKLKYTRVIAPSSKCGVMVSVLVSSPADREIEPTIKQKKEQRWATVTLSKPSGELMFFERLVSSRSTQGIGQSLIIETKDTERNYEGSSKSQLIRENDTTWRWPNSWKRPQNLIIEVLNRTLSCASRTPVSSNIKCGKPRRDAQKTRTSYQLRYTTRRRCQNTVINDNIMSYVMSCNLDLNLYRQQTGKYHCTKWTVECLWYPAVQFKLIRTGTIKISIKLKC
jgi:hypothetical protein